MPTVPIQAREALLAALGRHAPMPELTGLDGLLEAAAIEESTCPVATPVDDALVLELARVFGPSFGERAPRSAREAVLLRRGGSDHEAELRAAIGPFEEELRRCLARLERTASGPPLGAGVARRARPRADRPRPAAPAHRAEAGRALGSPRRALRARARGDGSARPRGPGTPGPARSGPDPGR